MFLFDLTSLLHSDCVIQFVKLCYYSCKSFDEIVPDLFIPPNGLRKLCLDSINQTSVPRSMDLCDVTSSVIFIFSWNWLSWRRNCLITLSFKHSAKTLITRQNFRYQQSCSVQEGLYTWNVLGVVCGIQIICSKMQKILLVVFLNCTSLKMVFKCENCFFT